MSLSTVMSRHEVDEITLTEISKVCNVSIEQIEDIYACTPLQVATVAESAIHSGSSVFQFVLTLSPSLDLGRFCIALQKVIAANSVLRTRLAYCRYGLVQVVINESHCTQWLSGNVEQYLRLNKTQPMGLGASLFRTAIIDRKLILTMHHGIMDHASLTPLFNDVLSVYYGQEPETRAEYKKFVTHCLEIDDFAAKDFWASRFKGSPAIFPKVEPGYVPLATNIVHWRIALDGVGGELPLAHIPSFIEAAWTLTASTYTGNESIAFGSILSGRVSACAVAETTLGPTIAVVPVQVNLKHDMTVEEILKDRATARRHLQTHHALQYGLTRIRTVNEAARLACGFQTLLNIRPRWYDPKESVEIAYDDMDEPYGAFALSLSFDLEDTAITIKAASDPTILCERQLNRILHQFEHYLHSLMKVSPKTKLGHLPRLNPHDMSDIFKWNDMAHQTLTVEKCLHELYRAQTQKHPTSIAVDAHDGRASYGELDEISDRLTQYLHQRGVSIETPVAFIFEKSIWTIVALLGIMKAGGTCVPIAASDPPARKAAIISTVGAKLVLVSAAEYTNSVGLAPDIYLVSAESVSNLPENFDSLCKGTSSPSSLAYILFTSGSTGLPKGVMLEHRCLASSLDCLTRRLGWQPGTRMLQFASHVWDISIGEIFGALLSGGCLCIPSEETRESDLAGYIESSKVNSAWLTPTVIRTMSPDDVPSLQSLLSIGEAVSPDTSRTWGKALRFINGWGPCEASILSTVAELRPDCPDPESIGTPVNCAIWIVNTKNVNELAPIGAVGEILVDGPGVARGYLNEDTKTKMAFIQPPLWAASRGKGSRRVYRTGDLAKYNPDGTIHFVGRQDSQVKIRGQRFELGEVEGVLATCREVRDVFSTTKICEGRTELVAVVCLADPLLPREAILQDLANEYSEMAARRLRAARDYARSRLPSYMVPTIWLAVERMPRTASAKLDRVAIIQWLKTRNLPSARAALDAAFTVALTPPGTSEEKLLQSIWSSVLNIAEGKIGKESLFGQLGGDSILAMQVVAQCLKRGFKIAMASLLKSIPLAAIAESSTRIISKGDEIQRSSKKPSGDDPVTKQTVDILDYVRARIPDLNRLNRHLIPENIDGIIPATNGQGVMISVGEAGGRGYYIEFTLHFRPRLDVERLRNACEQVILHHSILRTVFVRYGSALYQVILKGLPPNMVVEGTEESTPTISFREGVPLACFHLISDGQHCERLCIEIHHALYDAISLGLIFQDLDAAYAGKPLSDGPNFDSWLSHNEALDDSAPQEFWKGVLQGASMPFLVPPVSGAIRGCPLDEQIQIRVPIQNVKTSCGRPSSVIKAAWSLLIFLALGTRDIVFGEVSANRYLTLLGIDKVKGPCVNLVPVRARLDPTMTLASLVTQIQDLSTAGMPYHYLQTNSIIQQCTAWPRWTRFSTALVYQNHGSLPETLKIGDADATISYQGQLGDSTDIHVIATPGLEELEIELRYSSATFPSQQIHWIAQTLSKILEFFPSRLENTLTEVETCIHGSVGTYVLPPSYTAPSSALPDGCPLFPSAKAREIVEQAWRELNLLSIDQDEGLSIWDCGGDVLTALLLSQHYRACGYDIGTKDIICNPTRSMQASMLCGRFAETEHKL